MVMDVDDRHNVSATFTAPEMEKSCDTHETRVLPTESDLQEHSRNLYGDVRQHGWRVRLWHRFGYYNCDAWYEATVSRLVREGCLWIDVGGGKSVFPHNKGLSVALSHRCQVLVGVDPSANIEDNPYVHERVQCSIEEYKDQRTFDLATLRMVAEHIRNPQAAIASLARLIKPGGKIVLITPNRWSPVSIAASLIPFSLHQPITHFLWRTKEEDVFPTIYKMNTQRRLRTLFEEGGFRECTFAYLDNCSTFHRFRSSCFLELALWRTLKAFRLGYPENNLLGIYERV